MVLRGWYLLRLSDKAVPKPLKDIKVPKALAARGLHVFLQLHRTLAVLDLSIQFHTPHINVVDS